MFDVDLKVSLYCLVKEHTYCVGMAIWSKPLPAHAAANFVSHCCTMADDVKPQHQEQHSACIQFGLSCKLPEQSLLHCRAKTGMGRSSLAMAASMVGHSLPFAMLKLHSEAGWLLDHARPCHVHCLRLSCCSTSALGCVVQTATSRAARADMLTAVQASTTFRASPRS